MHSALHFSSTKILVNAWIQLSSYSQKRVKIKNSILQICSYNTVDLLLGLFVPLFSYKVSPADLTDLHVIRYELERDLMPLVLSNSQYSIERGQETLHEYDLPKIQQQIVSRFLLGKPLITLNVS